MTNNRNGIPNYELTSVWFNDTEKTEYNAWIEGRTLVTPDLILTLLEHQIKVSFTLQQNEETVLVSLTWKPQSKNQKGRVFMYRHKDLQKCLYIAFYHMSEVLDYSGQKEASISDTDW